MTHTYVYHTYVIYDDYYYDISESIRQFNSLVVEIVNIIIVK